MIYLEFVSLACFVSNWASVTTEMFVEEKAPVIHVSICFDNEYLIWL